MKYTLIVLMVILATALVSCSASRREANRKFRQIQVTPVSEINKGRYLELAKTISLDKFIEYYVRLGKEQLTISWGHTVLEQLYKDSAYTYFGRAFKDGQGLAAFYKVATNDLQEINLEFLNGNELRQRFIKEIAAEDKQQMLQRKSKCKPTGEYYSFAYKYISASNELAILCKCQIEFKCEFSNRRARKRIASKYNINKQQFVKCDKAELFPLFDERPRYRSSGFDVQ